MTINDTRLNERRRAHRLWVPRAMPWVLSASLVSGCRGAEHGAAVEPAPADTASPSVRAPDRDPGPAPTSTPGSLQVADLAADPEEYVYEQITVEARLWWGAADCVPNCSIEWLLVDVTDSDAWLYIVSDVEGDITCRPTTSPDPDSPCAPGGEVDPDQRYRVTGAVTRDAAGYSFMVHAFERLD